MEATAPTLSQSTFLPPGWVTARTDLVMAACALPACAGVWSAVMLSASPNLSNGPRPLLACRAMRFPGITPEGVTFYVATRG